MASLNWIDAFGEAIDAGRSALRRMEPDLVPARLRRVRAYSGGSLPPPLARSMLEALDSDPDLRQEALEAWEGDRPPAGGRSLAAYAFLERGESWVRTVVEECLVVGERRAVTTDESTALERDALAAEVASMRESRRREREEAQRTEADLRAELAEERAPAREDRRAERRALDRLESEREAWEATRAALEAETEATRSRLTALQEALAGKRASRTARAEALPPRGLALPRGPVELARFLDDLAAHTSSLVVRPQPGSEDPRGEPARLVFDASLRPDTAAAIDWLLQIEAAILVDGYNVGFQLASDPADARALALESARRMAAVARGEVGVIFDSAIEHSAGDRFRSGNVEVVFTEGQTADDEIVRRVGASAATVVISNDRQLRDRVEAAGAVALWSDALVSWSRRR